MLIHNNEVEARRMQVRTVNDKQYLLVEIGTFPDEPTPGYTSGQMIYVKEL